VSTPTHLRTAGTRRVLVAAVLLLLVAVVLGGCRSGDRAASATPAADPASTGSRAGTSMDPLADVEATVGAVERDADIATDADAGAAER
jgi:hypothetical protein